VTACEARRVFLWRCILIPCSRHYSMDNRTNVMAMMVLFAGIIALGATIISGEFFTREHPEKSAYIVEGVEADAEAAGTPAVAEVPIAMMMQTAEQAKGEEVFKKCASCHNAVSGGANGIGPNLWAIVGKPHAAHPGYTYSDALKGKPGNWDFEALNEWLKKPSAYAPGTKMSFAGLSKGEDRANVIAYLNAQGSNLPMPAMPAAAPAAAAPAAPAPAPAPAPKG
jgi:cytochrome c